MSTRSNSPPQQDQPSDGPPDDSGGLPTHNAVAQLPLAGQVAVKIRDLIVQDELKPGDRIRERQLSEQLNVSRTPLREALKILESERMIEIMPHRGAVVCDPGADEVKGLLQVLGALESLGGRLAAEQASDDEIAEIRALHFEMLAAYCRKDRLAYFKLNQLIHIHIMAAGKHDALVETHAQINARVFRVRYRTNQRQEIWHEAIEGHEDIISALEQRDGEQLSRLLNQHLANVWTKVSEQDFSKTDDRESR